MDLINHLWDRKFCILGSVFLTLGILNMIFNAAYAGEIKEYGPISGPITKPLEPIQRNML